MGKGRGAGEGGGAGALERDGVRDLLEGGEVARLAWDRVKVRARARARAIGEVARLGL